MTNERFNDSSRVENENFRNDLRIYYIFNKAEVDFAASFMENNT